MAGDRPRQPAYEIFSIKQQSKSRTLDSRRPAEASVKDSYPLKVDILPQLSRVAWKRLQIGTNVPFIITSISGKLFIGVNVDE